MNSDLGFYSYLSTAIGFAILIALLSTSALHKYHGKNLFIVCAVTLIWSLYIAILQSHTNTLILALLEWLRYASWINFLLGMIRSDKEDRNRSSSYLSNTSLWCIAAISLVMTITPTISLSSYLPESLPAQTLKLTVYVIIAISGLGIIEQIIRNSTSDQRWIVKYLCLGAGSLFAYDFFMFSEGLLFKQIDPQLWQARGIVNTLVIPLIAVSAARHSTLNLGIHVSRHVIFHSATIIGAGIYLIIMSAIGYYVRYISGSWGNLLQITFLFGAGVILATLLFSYKLRLNLKVILSKHFFSYKYDYRQQWREFTDNLANNEGDVPERTCRAIANLVLSSGALLWIKKDNERIELLTHWHIPEPDIDVSIEQKNLQSIAHFLQQSQWVIDIPEYLANRGMYPNLEIAKWILDIPKVWLIVPLVLQGETLGFILLKKSDVSRNIDWEDRDLLKLAGQQAAIHLVQYLSEKELTEARQFEAYHRLSTYIMHDLKNILAQQSLIVSNAERHRHKPEFIDDVISTVENSVQRMNRLLKQMKAGERSMQISSVSINTSVSNAVASLVKNDPKPQLLLSPSDTVISANEHQLTTIFGHFIQNSQEASAKDGSIEIETNYKDGQTTITITDTGSGMTPDFVRDRLFKPFDSTKGLTGMGIGAFESKQYILSLNGDIKVQSVQHQGTRITISLPSQPVSTDENQLKSLEATTLNS
jgi:putative PEP-CTERM system histidine kinase